jgi:hypothetical protein
MAEVETRYPKLADAQLAKLPWNRLKNIMNSVRATISSIEHHYGHKHCDVCIPPWHLDETMFKTDEERDLKVTEIIAPIQQYFDKLKFYASKLPHVDSSNPIKGKNK